MSLLLTSWHYSCVYRVLSHLIMKIISFVKYSRTNFTKLSERNVAPGFSASHCVSMCSGALMSFARSCSPISLPDVCLPARVTFTMPPPDQTRPDPIRPDPTRSDPIWSDLTRPDQTRPDPDDAGADVCLPGPDRDSKQRIHVCYSTCSKNGCNGYSHLHRVLDLLRRRRTPTLARAPDRSE